MIIPTKRIEFSIQVDNLNVSKSNKNKFKLFVNRVAKACAAMRLFKVIITL